jgi:metal-responsive CopG/Arc/MetJ family transcriptional regulator
VTAKVAISLPDELLERLDTEANTLGMARSELVQESVASYLSVTAQERAADAPRRRMLEAIEGMRTFHVGREVLDDRPTLEILREIRETDDSAPLRGRDDQR